LQPWPISSPGSVSGRRPDNFEGGVVAARRTFQERPGPILAMWTRLEGEDIISALRLSRPLLGSWESPIMSAVLDACEWTKEFVDGRPLEPVDVNGRSGPVQVYELLRFRRC
jgi:hypothetical protein